MSDGGGIGRGRMVGLAGRVRRSGSQRPRPGGRALVGSVTLHAVAVAVLVLSGLMAAPRPDTFIAYEVKLVSPAAAQPAPEPTEAEPPVVEEEEEPEEEPEPEPEPEPTDEPEPEPEATIPEEEPEAEEPDPDPEPEPETTEEPEEEPSPPEEEEEETPRSPQPTPEDSASGGEGLNVSLTGERFPFPGYLDNIIVQINRYFRWTGRSDLEAEFAFVIHRDGTVSDLRVLRGSGDVAFDYEAMGAIEQAASSGAFGRLPDGFEGDRLPISFYFRPPR